MEILLSALRASLITVFFFIIVLDHIKMVDFEIIRHSCTDNSGNRVARWFLVLSINSRLHAASC